MPKISRRQFASAAAVAAGGIVVGYVTKGLVLSNVLPSPETPPNSPDDALSRLMQGNMRYMQGSPIYPNQSAERQAEVAQGQHPWAAILGCIDSRVPPELVFDQGLGDMYVARTAGQVINDVVIASLEYAFLTGAKLVMVLGHQSCGAVKAAISAVQTGTQPEGHLPALTDAIKPAVIQAESQPGDLLENSIKANVTLEAQYLTSDSSILSNSVNEGAIKIVGANYDLGTGAVSLL